MTRIFGTDLRSSQHSWLLEASAEKMEGLISSVTSSLKNTSHARKASSSENHSHCSMKRSYLIKGRANTSCLVHSSENNGKKGPKVCDFPGEARSPNGTIRFFAHPSELKHFGDTRGVIHPGPGMRGSCHHCDLVEQAHQTVLGSVV
jgi:hypothetical protein